MLRLQPIDIILQHIGGLSREKIAGEGLFLNRIVIILCPGTGIYAQRN